MKTWERHHRNATIGDRTIEVVACGDNETPEGQVDFYDLFEHGECINLGDPFDEEPTDEQIKHWIGQEN